jgi:mono/diheme cytochrome c family protein
MRVNRGFAGLTTALAFASLFPAAHAADAASGKQEVGASKANAALVSRGRYLLTVGSCNDCHTAGFAAADGNVPEKDWLLGGGPLGFRGPWGTTYAPNLRASLARMTEAEWVKYAKALKTRPPMPWFNLNQWTTADLRAFYQYVKQLGPGEQTTPAYVPPDKEPPMPYVQWPMRPASAPGGKK